MTDEFVSEAERTLADHGAFEQTNDGFAVTTSPFDARVRLSAAGGAVSFRVTVRAPTLDAAVAGETVAPVVEEGWFETFELRVEDVDAATRADLEPPRVERDERQDEVVVEAAFETDLAARGVEDAKAVVDYVEGTYMEGVIPGYTYRDPVSTMVERARDQGQLE